MQFDCCGVDPINERCQRSQATTGAKKSHGLESTQVDYTICLTEVFQGVFLIHEHIKRLAADEHACAVRVHSAAPS